MKQSLQIAASILSANFSELKKDTANALHAGADLIHFDVMDNHFVPHLTIGPLVCQSLRNNGIDAAIDVHLMTERPDSLIEPFTHAGATQISFHVETKNVQIEHTLQHIHQCNCQAGLALNPETPPEQIKPYLMQIDNILIMSVQPGCGGQTFIPETLEKIRTISIWVKEHQANCNITVDGGVNIDNIAQIAEAGANVCVTGSALFNSQDYRATINAMRI